MANFGGPDPRFSQQLIDTVMTRRREEEAKRRQRQQDVRSAITDAVGVYQTSKQIAQKDEQLDLETKREDRLAKQSYQDLQLSIIKTEIAQRELDTLKKDTTLAGWFRSLADGSLVNKVSEFTAQLKAVAGMSEADLRKLKKQRDSAVTLPQNPDILVEESASAPADFVPGGRVGLLTGPQQ